MTPHTNKLSDDSVWAIALRAPSLAGFALSRFASQPCRALINYRGGQR